MYGLIKAPSKNIFAHLLQYDFVTKMWLISFFLVSYIKITCSTCSEPVQRNTNVVEIVCFSSDNHRGFSFSKQSEKYKLFQLLLRKI